uniref:PARP4 MVP-ID C-terminal domain-containing protein n=2 Tax=Micrurus carvalhoi TaxID=3147026 RepID=A0A2H6MVH8_9SAUR
MGDSNLWKVLRYLRLLYPSKSKRNIILISDGHIQNEGMTLQVVKKNALHTRIFTCGVSPTANRHMLRSLSHYGDGAFEYFDVKSKYNWERKVKSQTTRMFSPQCSSISIEWQTHMIENPNLSFTPAQICVLFNHERLLVYGFVHNCTEAILKAQVDNQELYTLVSTSELQKTTGTILHKLAARAFIREYEQGMLDENETQHEMKREQLKSNIIELSLKHSIVTQFTSFVAIEKREADEDQSGDTLDHLEPVAIHDVDILPYIDYSTGEILENENMILHSCSMPAYYYEDDISDSDIPVQEADEDQSGDTLDHLEPVAIHDVDILPYIDYSTGEILENENMILHSCSMPAYYYEDGISESDIPVQELSGVLCKSAREEIAFEQPPRPLVCKTVPHTKKKAVPNHLLAFHSEEEILKSSKKEKRSAFYKRQTTASKMKLNTTHYAAKSSEENSCQDRVPRSLNVPLSSVDWPQLFKLQNQDGFWQLTSELGMLLDLDVHHLINFSLAKKGIQSLGPKGKEKLLQLIATLLVLQAIYFKQLEGLLFKSLMKLKDSPPSWALNPVRNAIEWANRTNLEFPGICQRLQLGKDWDDATKKLLGI